MSERMIMFIEGEEAIDYKSGNKREKSTVVSEIRKIKQEGKIKSYEIKDLLHKKLFVIEFEDGNITKIDLEKKDYYAIILETILKRKKKIYDEVTYSIVGGTLEKEENNIRTFSPWEAIVSIPGKEEKQVKSPLEIIDYIKCMYQNDEIEKFHRKGIETVEYDIITVEQEKIRIITSSNNKAMPLLDALYENYREKNNKLFQSFQKVATFTNTFALIVTSPYKAAFTHHDYQVEDIQSNLLLMSSYYKILKESTMTNDDFENFEVLVNKTLSYYEKNNMTSSIDYEILIDYKILIDSKRDTIGKAL